MVDLVLLGDGKSDMGQELGRLCLQHICKTHLATSGRKSVQQ